jgi:hypothetical protein
VLSALLYLVGIVVLPLLLLALALLGDHLVGARIRGTPYPPRPSATAVVVATAAKAPRPSIRPAHPTGHMRRVRSTNAVGKDSSFQGWRGHADALG